MKTHYLKNLLILNLFLIIPCGVIAQNNFNKQDCSLVNISYQLCISKYNAFLKKDTIYFENTNKTYEKCLRKTIRNIAIIDFHYLDKDTLLFLNPQKVVSLSYYNRKHKFVRMGLSKIQYLQNSGSWETILQGNIEVYFNKKKNSRLVRKIVKTF